MVIGQQFVSGGGVVNRPFLFSMNVDSNVTLCIIEYVVLIPMKEGFASMDCKELESMDYDEMIMLVAASYELDDAHSDYQYGNRHGYKYAIAHAFGVGIDKVHMDVIDCLCKIKSSEKER